jgi:hypothetical protein
MACHRNLDRFVSKVDGISTGSAVQVHPSEGIEGITVGPEFDFFAEPGRRAGKSL